MKSINMEDIARLAGVSKPTVSRALNDSPLVNAKTKRRVIEIAKHHGYAVNRNAQKLRLHRTRTVAVSVDFQEYRENHISDPFILEMLAGVSEALGDRDQDLFLCSFSHNNVESLQQLVLSRTVDGIIFLGQGHREEMIESLAELGVPLVVWGALSDEEKYCVVGSDNYHAGQLVGEYFTQEGRKKVLFVGDLTYREFALRCEGLKKGLTANAELSFSTPRELSFNAALQACRKSFNSSQIPFDAIFTYNDNAAMAAIRVIKEKGLIIGEEINVVGFNDIPAASQFMPSITTVRQNTKLAGSQLVGKLMQILQDGQSASSFIETKLVLRET